MPWKTSDLFQQREDFVRRAASGHGCFSRLCQSFGISRQTGYKWLFRYLQADKTPESLREVLSDASRRPHNSPFRVRPDVAEQVLQLRTEHGWGATKLSLALRQAGITGGHATVHKILKEHGQIAAEDPSSPSWIRQLFVADDPYSKLTNELPGISTAGGFAEHLTSGPSRDRKAAMAGLAGLKSLND